VALAPNVFAFAAGGKLNMHLSRRFALRLVQADYFQTRLRNVSNNRQNHLWISGSAVFGFGEQSRWNYGESCEDRNALARCEKKLQLKKRSL